MLSSRQAQVLEKMSGHWQTPYQIGTNVQTLNKLIKEKLVERRMMDSGRKSDSVNMLYRKVGTETSA